MVVIVPLSPTAKATVGPPAVAASGSSDVAASFSFYGPTTFSWTHTPAATPTLATLACAVHDSQVTLLATYGGATMNTAITNQLPHGYDGFYVGMFFLNSPPPGAQSVAVTLAYAKGQVYAEDIECSATTWTGTAGIDMSIANVNQDLCGCDASITLSPKAPVPSNEVFFGGVFRSVWGAPTTLYASGTGATASVVDSNTNAGTGLGYGCQLWPSSPDYDCIGSAQLLTGGTSLTMGWTYGAFIVAAGFGIIAATVIWAPGYMGNELYLTAGLQITSNPLFIYPRASAWASVAWPGYFPEVKNAINLTVGQNPHKPQSNQTVFDEYYVGSQGIMMIDIPIAAAGADIPQPTVNLYVSCIGIYLNLYNAPSANTIMVGSPYNYLSGINTTGTFDTGNTKSVSIWDLGLDALGFLPFVGYVTGSYQTMKDLQQLTAITQSSNLNGGTSGSVLFNVVGGTVSNGVETQNVFTAQDMIEVHIGSGDFSNTVQFDFAAQNFEYHTQGSCSPIDYTARAAYLDMRAYPAGAMSGAVLLPGDLAVSNAVITLYQQTAGVYGGTTFKEYNSNVSGAGYGMYAFAGQLGATYAVTATYYNPFGPVSSPSYTVTAPSSPTDPYPTTQNLYVPAPVIEGEIYNTNGGTGVPIGGATVYVQNSGGASYSTTTNSNGMYYLPVNTVGTYSVRATAPGFSDSSWQSVGVTVMNTVYTQNIGLASGYSIAPIHNGGHSGNRVWIDDLNGHTVYVGYADANGNVPGTTGLFPGTYLITADRECWSVYRPEPPGYDYFYFQGRASVTIGPDASPTLGWSNTNVRC